MEKTIIRTVGDYNIDIINEEKKTRLDFLVMGIAHRNKSLAKWDNLSVSHLIDNAKFIKLLLIIKDFNDAKDIYEQMNLERGMQLACEHLLDLIISTNKEIEQYYENERIKEEAREKNRIETMNFYNKHVLPQAHKLKQVLEELEKINVSNYYTQGQINLYDFRIIKKHFEG